MQAVLQTMKAHGSLARVQSSAASALASLSAHDAALQQAVELGAIPQLVAAITTLPSSPEVVVSACNGLASLTSSADESGPRPRQEPSALGPVLVLMPTSPGLCIGPHAHQPWALY